MRRACFSTWGVALILVVAAVCTAQDKKASPEAEEAPPAIEEVPAPPSEVPAEPAEVDVAAQPINLVYVGPEGSFLLQPGRSRGIFRWSGTHWANSISFVFEDANYWVYRLDNTDGWFAFSKNPTGTTYLLWKGRGAASNSITWQNLPNGWMHATRSTATGNLN